MSIELGTRVARLEEAVSSVRSGQSVMQWACGIAMALMIALTAALLNRTFAVADNIIALARETGKVAGSLEVLQSDLLGVKADLREARAEFHADLGDVRSELRSELGGVRSELRSELGGVRSELTALRAAVERLAAATEAGRPTPQPGTPPQQP